MKIINLFKKLFNKPEPPPPPKKKEEISFKEMCLRTFPPDDWGVFDVEWGLPSTHEILMIMLADAGPGEQIKEKRSRKKAMRR